MSESSPEIHPEQSHYPYATRTLLSLYEAGELDNVEDVVVEPNYGYVANIGYINGTSRVINGSDVGLNSGAAASTVSDKGHTKFFLREWGINCPDGEEFVMPWWSDTIKRGRLSQSNTTITTTDQASSYIEQNMGYPVYVKPVDGSKGGNIHKVYDDLTLQNVFVDYAEKRVKVAMVEEPVLMPDYRIVMLDGNLISAYRRDPLAVVGNGNDTIASLLTKLQETYHSQGRDTRIDFEDQRMIDYLAKHELDMLSVPGEGDRVVLSAVSNLSLGGTSEDVSDRIAERWVSLSAFIAGKFSLRLCGVDLACNDIADEQSDYSVLEVNAAPGLDHYALSGEAQQRLVRSLYAEVFNAMPPSRNPKNGVMPGAH